MSGAALVRLDQLEPKTCGVIARVDAANDSIEQLMAMGVCVGRKVEVVQHGDPLILRVLGSRIGLSARLAHSVMVDPCHESRCASSPHEPMGGVEP
jgi:Fe2+ transport system protein FeoA